LGGHQVVRSLEALRLHPAFNELNLADWLIHSESQGKPQVVHEPILITNQGFVLAGFAEWHAAVCAGQGEIVCIEFALSADEALQLILTLHRPRTAWNDFTRTELALEQEACFQSKALANQIAGGKHKGLANLPKAEHIDVREEIANLAGVSSRTVGNVEIILKKAHQCLVEALHKWHDHNQPSSAIVPSRRGQADGGVDTFPRATIKQQDEPRVYRQTSSGKA
jgi:hypothetical protein